MHKMKNVAILKPSGLSVMFAIVAVSYTHLDVYKRQEEQVKDVRAVLRDQQFLSGEDWVTKSSGQPHRLPRFLSVFCGVGKVKTFANWAVAVNSEISGA